MDQFESMMIEAVDDFNEAHARTLRLLANVGDLLNNRITAAEYKARNAALEAEVGAAEKRREERARKVAEGT